MKQFTTTITQRGQVTIPAEVRRLLNLKPRDKVSFEIDDVEVRLKPVAFTLESTFGSVKPSNRPEDFDAILSEVKDAKSERTVHLLRDA